MEGTCGSQSEREVWKETLPQPPREEGTSMRTMLLRSGAPLLLFPKHCSLPMTLKAAVAMSTHN